MVKIATLYFLCKNIKIVSFDKQRQNKTSVIVLFALTCAYCYVKIYMIKN